MSFVVNPKRNVTFDHTTNSGDEFSVTFKFVAAEDVDYGELRTKTKNKSEMIVEGEDGKEIKMEEGTYNAFLYSLRK